MTHGINTLVKARDLHPGDVIRVSGGLTRTVDAVRFSERTPEGETFHGYVYGQPMAFVFYRETDGWGPANAFGQDQWINLEGMEVQ